jgi:prophage regulatory protein
MSENRASTPLVILRRNQVEARTGLSCSSIYRYIAEGKFPAPIDLGGGRSVGWLEHEIDAFIASRVAASRGQGG